MWPLLSAVSVATLAIAPAGASESAVSENVRVRERPDLDSPIVALLYEGQQVRVLEEAGEFVRIRTEIERQGYIRAVYLDALQSKGCEAGAPFRTDACTINVGSLVLRRGMGKQTPVVGYIAQGDALQVIAREGEYAQVTAHKVYEGYLKAEYLSGDAPAEATVSAMEAPGPAAAANASGSDEVTADAAPAEAASTSSPAAVAADTPQTDAEPPASEPTVAPAATASKSWTVQLGAGALVSAVPRDEIRGRITQDGVPNTVEGYDLSRPVTSLSLGYAIGPRWQLRLGYRWVDNDNGSVIAPADRYAELAASAREHYPVVAPAWTLGLDLMWVQWDRWQGHVDAGVLLSGDSVVSGQAGQPTIRIAAPDTTWYAGTAVQYQLTPSWRLGAHIGFSEINGLLIDPQLTVSVAF